MSYFSLVRRVPEAAAIDPQAMTWLYGLVTQMPLMRRAYRRFVAGALALGVLFGWVMFSVVRHRGPRPYFEPQSFLDGFGTARGVGLSLFGDYIFAFEAASVLLVAAMVGAVLMAKGRLR